MSHPTGNKKPFRRPRATNKQDLILNALRQDILDGRLLAGGRVPIHTALAARFKVSTLTVQRALDRLENDGFIHSRKRLGTFVINPPPHLRNIALVFPPSATENRNEARFYLALTNEAIACQKRTQRNILQFHGIDGHSDTEDHQRLLDYLTAHRLGGIVFTTSPHLLEGSPILELPGVPRVAIMADTKYPQVASVSYDQHSFIDQALDYFASRDRRRVAIVKGDGEWRAEQEYLEAALAARQMICPPFWQQSVSRNNSVAARNCVHLLMRGASNDRPNALIIADDNLAEQAQAGLIAAGVRVPADLEVITHCNHPWPPPSVLPLRRLGFDTARTLQLCIDLIDRQRRNESVPPRTLLPAVFEEQLTTPAANVLETTV